MPGIVGNARAGMSKRRMVKATRTGTEDLGMAWARFKIVPVSVSVPIYWLESSPELLRPAGFAKS